MTTPTSYSRMALLAATLGLLAGCGSLEENVAGQAAATPQTCAVDTPTGTSIARKRCVTPMTAEEKAAMQRDIQQASGVHLCPKGGC